MKRLYYKSNHHCRVELEVLEQMVAWEVLELRDQLETLARLEHLESLVDQ